MLETAYQRTVIAYHGCEREVGEGLLLGGLFQPSSKPYDWLGHGVYFWEFGPRRAMEWAKEKMKRKTHRIKHPFVVGAVIHLGKCFDLLDVANTQWLTGSFPAFREARIKAGQPIPENKSAGSDELDDRSLRFLDCAMIDWSLKLLDTSGAPYDTVRGGFAEGGACYTGSKIQSKTHIQIAVRNLNCIVGVFRPTDAATTP